MIKLFSKEPSSTDVLARLEADQERRSEILVRMHAITPNTQENPVSEYQAALVADAGEAEILLAEYRALGRELDSISNQRAVALHEELDAAKAREAAQALPKLIKGLDARLADYDRADQALKDSRAALDQHVDRITGHRQALGGGEFTQGGPSVPGAQAERICDLRGLHEIDDRPGVYSLSRALVYRRLTGEPSPGASRPEKNAKESRDERDAYQEF